MADATEYQATFELVDGDKDGYVSADELKRLMQVLGEEVDEEQLARVVAGADRGGDGLISLQEFADFMAAGASQG
ncbi:MAG: EF-hand domain-containing protein [Actinomadura sp.]